ncbi:ChiQ/YbfN family lipoprotein [Tatumella sp. UBA2305]|uniref:ChiQ/YbfN family lipoprotein n=1 Tax=Tatumella sp. UBA2305 TaxID=1947647 RepID=UPI0025E258AD|nr:ChiQ/YbfN family lipoprotein [Tatumella sp. UBA2305]
MKYLMFFLILAGLTACQQKISPADDAENQETVSPRDYQKCINALKSGDDEDAVDSCHQVTEEIREK